MRKNNDNLYYLIETAKSVFVCKNEKQALEKKVAIELLCNEKAEYKIMRQMSLEEYLQESVKKNKVIRWEEICEKVK